MSDILKFNSWQSIQRLVFRFGSVTGLMRFDFWPALSLQDLRRPFCLNRNQAAGGCSFGRFGLPAVGPCSLNH